VAARTVFEETDFRAVRVSQITERAGVSYGLFYHYFDSKEAIFRAVAATAYQQLMDSGMQLEQSRPVHADAWSIEQGVRDWFGQYRRDSAMIRAIEAVAQFDAEIEATRAAINLDRQRSVGAILRVLQQQGQMDQGLDPDVAAVAIADMVWRFAESWLLRGDIECDFDQGVEQISRLIGNALRLDPPPS
jgi:AcrR family transcriptional regulator